MQTYVGGHRFRFLEEIEKLQIFGKANFYSKTTWEMGESSLMVYIFYLLSMKNIFFKQN